MLGLEYSVNDAELMKYFSQFGEVAAAEVITTGNTCMYTRSRPLTNDTETGEEEGLSQKAAEGVSSLTYA